METTEPQPNGAPTLTHRPFARALREARIAEKLTGPQLAEAIGVSPQQISHVECGANKPSLETYEKLVRLMPSLATAQKPRKMRKQRKPYERRALDTSPTSQEKAAPPLVGGGYAGAIAEVKAAKKGIANLEAAVKKAKERLRVAISRADAEHRKMLAALST